MEDFCNLFNLQTSEELHFDNSALPLVSLSEEAECIFQADQSLRFVVGKVQVTIERNSFHRPAAFAGLVPSGVIHQNLAHDSSRHCEEVKPVLPFWLPSSGKSKECLVDECSWLKRVIPALVAEAHQSHSPKLYVEQSQKSRFRLAIARSEAAQQVRDVRTVSRLLCHTFLPSVSLQ